MREKIWSWVCDNRWFVGFTGVFAVLMACVFWGTWSPDVAPVMPDDGVAHSLSWQAQVRGWWNGFLADGKFVPGDLISKSVIFSKYWTQEFKYAVSAYFAALGLAYFLRGRRLSHLASYGAGLLLGFCGYWLTLFSAGHAGWFYWMTYGIFAFGFADRAVRFGKMRQWVLLGACVAWGCFYQADLWLLFTVFTGIYLLTVCVWERRFPWKGMLVAMLAFAVIAAPGVWSAFTCSLVSRDQQIAETVKPLSEAEKKDPAAKAKAEAEARWVFTTNWSLPPKETVEFVRARANGDTSCQLTCHFARADGKDTKPYTGALGPRGGSYRQHSLYVGLVTCILALVGCVCGLVGIGTQEASKSGRRQVVAFFTVAAVLCWLLSLGRFCEPVYRLVYALPFGDYLRAPVKWHHLTELSLCVLAGFGIDALWRMSKAPWARILLTVAVLVGAIDLVRVDRLYCAPIDLQYVRGRSAMAEQILKSGKGRVADLASYDHRLRFPAWNLGSHGVSVTHDPNEKGVKFILVRTQQVAQDSNLAGFLRACTTLVGCYSMTDTGLYSDPSPGASLALFQLKAATDPIPKAPVKPGVLAMGLVSVLGTVVALVVVFWRRDRTCGDVCAVEQDLCYTNPRSQKGEVQ